MADDSESSRPMNTVQWFLGSINAKLDAIDNSLSRMTFRLDELEKRTEKLELGMNKGDVWTGLVEKGVFAVLGAVGVMAMKALGLWG